MALTHIAAVILAGGRAERMGGVSKADIEIGGVRLIERLHHAVAHCDPILIAAARNAVDAAGAKSIADLESDYAGPLAGVAAAISALRDTNCRWLLSAAVDTPFFPEDFAERAIALSGEADVVVGCFGAQDYPTNALWRMDAIADLPKRVVDGSALHSLRRLAASLRSVRLDYSEVVAEDPFANVNAPEDLINLRSRDSGVART